MPSFEYGKGWWDHVELVRRFADYVDAAEVRVVGHHHVDTPPPCERLPIRDEWDVAALMRVLAHEP